MPVATCSNFETLESPGQSVTMSGRPSQFMSATRTWTGPFPTAKEDAPNARSLLTPPPPPLPPQAGTPQADSRAIRPGPAPAGQLVCDRPAPRRRGLVHRGSRAGRNEADLRLVAERAADCAVLVVSLLQLADPAVRKQLVEGGEAAVQASTDPMIALARKLDPMRRELIKWTQDNVQSVEERGGEQIGKARFAA